VAEWIGTPHIEDGDADSFLRVFAQPSTTKFWVAGGSFSNGSPSFAEADTRDRTWSSPDTGLRCAQSVEFVVENLNVDLPGGLRFELAAEGGIK
jgi:hypothetical protein